MDISDHRKRIDEIDSELIRLLDERMDIVKEIAEYKQAHGLEVFDPAREQEKLEAVGAQSSEETAEGNKALFRFIMDLSKEHQRKMIEK